MLHRLILRCFCKLHEYVLIFYTRLRRGFELDPSKVLIDCYTAEQVKAQLTVDQALGSTIDVDGELLVLIPFRDRWDLTLPCLAALSRQALPKGLHVRVVLIDNGSVEEATREGMAQVASNFPTLNLEALSANYKFNYSRLNNDGYRQHKTTATKWVLFLNNDVELGDRQIVQKMAACLDSILDAGVVGCTLLYPDRRIQHIFAAPGVKIIAAHPIKGKPYDAQMEWFAKPVRPVPAVTGAVMMVRAADFERVGMFDEELPTLGQDIILCTSIRTKLGKFTLAVASGEVTHCESVTKEALFPINEIDYLYNKYGVELEASPFYDDRLSRWSEQPVYALAWAPKYPVRSVINYKR